MRIDVFDRLQSVVGDMHFRPMALHQFDGELLVDRIVFDQQNPQSGKIGCQHRLLLQRRKGRFISRQPLDQVAQRFGEHGLGHEMPGAQFLGRTVNDLRIVGGHDHRQGRLGADARLERSQHSGAVKPRHDPVDQQQVIGTPALFGLFDHRKGAVSIVRAIDAARTSGAHSEGTEQVGQRQTGIGLVVDYQYPHGIGTGQSWRRRRWWFGQRKARGKDKTRTLAADALDPNFSTHQFDDFFCDGQAQTGSAIFPRGGAVRLRKFLEESPDLFLGHANTGVSHREAQHFGAFVAVLDAYHQLDMAAVRELDGVRQQVVQDLTESQRIAHQCAAFSKQP